MAIVQSFSDMVGSAGFQQVASQAWPAILAIVLCYYALRRSSSWLSDSPKPAFPLLNPKKRFLFGDFALQKDFFQNAQDMVARRLREAPDAPFRMLSGSGEFIVLPPKYAHEIRNHEHLDFNRAASRWFCANYAGMEGFHEATAESDMMKHIARTQLTHQLTLVTQPLSDECAAALRDIWGDSPEWHPLGLREATMQLAARMTSRVYLGMDLCRDPDWLRITTTYTTTVFAASEELRVWPEWMRPAAQWFLPRCTEARQLVREARALIWPVLRRRRAAKQQQQQNAIVYNDAIEWSEQHARDKKLEYDPACVQLALSVTGQHSTTDFLSQILLDIATHPDLMEPLRAEIRHVLGGDTGWTKASLYNLKLLDSVMKESQRRKPIAVVGMRRYATRQITLSDGTVIPKDSLTFVSAHRQWDDAAYPPDARAFDGYRFLRMRRQEATCTSAGTGKENKENMAQLVSTGTDYLGFGYGKHACPGRFFASEEVKIALCHILTKYDIQVAEGTSVEPLRMGLTMLSNPTARILVRRRVDQEAEALLHL